MSQFLDPIPGFFILDFLYFYIYIFLALGHFHILYICVPYFHWERGIRNTRNCWNNYIWYICQKCYISNRAGHATMSFAITNNFEVWKHGHVVAAVLSRAQLCLTVLYIMINCCRWRCSSPGRGTRRSWATRSGSSSSWSGSQSELYIPEGYTNVYWIPVFIQIYFNVSKTMYKW